jgi:hypothetical protein
MRLRPTTVAIAVLALAACDAPPPERQSEEAKQAREASDLREHIQTPIDKAKGVEDIQKAHDADQREAIDALEAGEAVPADDAGADEEE